MSVPHICAQSEACMSLISVPSQRPVCSLYLCPVRGPYVPYIYAQLVSQSWSKEQCEQLFEMIMSSLSWILYYMDR